MATGRTKFILIFIWVLSLVISIGPLVNARVMPQESSTGEHYYQCDEQWKNDGTAIVYDVFMLCVVYVIPLGVLIWAYSVTGVILWRRTLPGNAQGDRDVSQLIAKKKIIKMLSVIVLAFALCWLPLNIFNMVITINQRYLRESVYHDVIITIYLTCFWMAMANSFLNPIIYTFLNETFREDLMRLVNCVRNGNNKRKRKDGRRRTISMSSGASHRSMNSRVTSTLLIPSWSQRKGEFVEHVV
ncbi:substance-K receptor-like [Saccoglossus kowalevskii]|uniref:Substance-K receptor-like n=1 Tax=Saccoglossus kowalevskii TaxID=10224 RepID=A0ABM0LVF5_SACKO|nr:PREDICTED: substance-K receptor-like [Saccoglossus kowalevskii]